MKYYYNVIDTTSGEQIGQHITAQEIHKLIGISTSQANYYADRGFKYQRRYRIERVETEKPINLAAEWDYVTEFLRRFPEVTRRIRISCGEK